MEKTINEELKMLLEDYPQAKIQVENDTHIASIKDIQFMYEEGFGNTIKIII